MKNSTPVKRLIDLLDELNISQKEFILDSGFVLQFSQANNLNLEVVMHNLLNVVIEGTVDTE